MVKLEGFTDDQRRRVVAALESLDQKSLLAHLSSPAELHQFMLNYNWDDGVDAVRMVFASPHCDQGTALLAYWLSGPMTCLYTSREDCEPFSANDFDCFTDLENRLLSDSYRNRHISIDPANLMAPGDDWTQQSLPRQPPPSLCRPSPGAPMIQDDLAYELTSEEVKLREAAIDEESIAPLEQAACDDPRFEANLSAYREWMRRRKA